MRIAIVTDDVTSATDGAVALAEAGWSVRVIRGTALEAADVVSVDAATRTGSRDNAIERVRAVGAALVDVPLIIKQFDSTLRGHVAAETLALLGATGRTRAVVAPAFPSAGRITQDGIQFLHGVPVASSEYARDPLNPVSCSDVAMLFEAEGVSGSVSERDNPLVLIRDARDEMELDAVIAEYAARSDVLLAGSTGLVRALARCGPRPRQARAVSSLGRSRRVLIIVGSLNHRSREQLEFLSLRTRLPVFMLNGFDDPMLLASRIARRFDTDPAVALVSTEKPASPYEIAQRLAKVTAELVRRSAIEGMIVTGGDVFGAVLDHLNVSVLEVLWEIEPGIPVCRIERPYSFAAISKAGGFGTNDIFLTALTTLLSGSGGVL